MLFLIITAQTTKLFPLSRSSINTNPSLRPAITSWLSGSDITSTYWSCRVHLSDSLWVIKWDTLAQGLSLFVFFKKTLCTFRKHRNPVWMSWYMTAAWKHQKSQVNFICIAHLNNIIYVSIYTPMYKCIYIHTFRHIQTCLHHSVTLSHNKYRQNSKACEKCQVFKKSCLMCRTDLSWLVF